VKCNPEPIVPFEVAQSRWSGDANMPCFRIATPSCAAIKPDRILVIDQTLSRAKFTVRMYYPDMDPRELAFRTVSQDEFLEIIAGAAALERPEIQSADYGYEFKVKSLGSHPNN
jgi:hypothetical protein